MKLLRWPPNDPSILFLGPANSQLLKGLSAKKVLFRAGNLGGWGQLLPRCHTRQVQRYLARGTCHMEDGGNSTTSPLPKCNLTQLCLDSPFL
jgi:hypothetical protein